MPPGSITWRSRSVSVSQVSVNWGSPTLTGIRLTTSSPPPNLSAPTREALAALSSLCPLAWEATGVSTVLTLKPRRTGIELMTVSTWSLSSIEHGSTYLDDVCINKDGINMSQTPNLATDMVRQVWLDVIWAPLLDQRIGIVLVRGLVL